MKGYMLSMNCNILRPTLPARLEKRCSHEAIALTQTCSDPETNDGLSVRPFYMAEAQNIIPRK